MPAICANSSAAAAVLSASTLINTTAFTMSGFLARPHNHTPLTAEEVDDLQAPESAGGCGPRGTRTSFPTATAHVDRVTAKRSGFVAGTLSTILGGKIRQSR